MSGKGEEPEDDFDDLDRASRVNFRDYPSSALVVVAALGSGLAWMLYRWMGKKNAAPSGSPGEDKASDAVPQADPSDDGTS